MKRVIWNSQVWKFKLETWNSKFETWNLKFWKLKFEAWNMKLAIWNLKCWKLKFETWNMRLEIWSLKLKNWNFKYVVTRPWNQKFSSQVLWKITKFLIILIYEKRNVIFYDHEFTDISNFITFFVQISVKKIIYLMM